MPAEAKTLPRGRKLVIAAAAAVSFCLGAGVAVSVAPTSKALRGRTNLYKHRDGICTHEHHAYCGATCTIESPGCTRCTIYKEGAYIVLCMLSSANNGEACQQAQNNYPGFSKHWEETPLGGECYGSRGWKRG